MKLPTEEQIKSMKSEELNRIAADALDKIGEYMQTMENRVKELETGFVALTMLSLRLETRVRELVKMTEIKTNEMKH